MFLLLIILNFILIILNPILIKLKVLPFFISNVIHNIQKIFFQYIYDVSSLEKWILLFLLVNGILIIFITIKSKMNYLFIKKDFNKYNSVAKLQKMNWEDYEEFVKKIFICKGYQVDRQGGHGSDGGIDLIIKKRTEKSMVQCKRYTSNVGVKVIREMYAVGLHHGFKKVYIYTTSGFTKEAYEFAKGKNLILCNGIETLKQIRKIVNK